MDKGIEYILEVARCGGITKAAENLFITPSALSKFVQARESEFQVKLFHRVGKRFVLTHDIISTMMATCVDMNLAMVAKTIIPIFTPRSISTMVAVSTAMA